ncbi:undecaprenyldiphospho-muramoylpentapeptide beta-N-acetylglucosaminyltransferase [bacterium]|nr:undecaprenyldiphospho-muramoylpentapeptide beta-N-acetylglucosaminyltransferase [bacterium]
MEKRRYFITGGGTGGHIYPALAVFEELLKLDTTGEMYYIGNKKNPEYPIVTGKKYNFLDVDVFGMPRKIGFRFVIWAWNLFFAIVKSCFYIIKYRPCAIFGTGGYVSAPVIIAGKLLHIPYVMHDCDACPGLVTRKLAPYAKSVSLAFEDAKKYIKNDKIFVNGNPVREEFRTLTRENALKNLSLEDKLTICIMGGSQGAKSINSATVKILKQLLDKDIQVIFQTGRKNFESVSEKLYEIYPEYKNNKNLVFRPYFDDMMSALKASDIVVGRSGSLSLSEICACGAASILVPYPHAAADHQRINARYMEKNGASIYVEDADLTADRLLTTITDLIENSDKLEKLKSCAAKLAKFDGAKNIVEQINSGL